MKDLRRSHTMRRIFYLGMVVFVLAPLAGCEEANLAIDSILGRRSPVSVGSPAGVLPVARSSEKKNTR